MGTATTTFRQQIMCAAAKGAEPGPQRKLSEWDMRSYGMQLIYESYSAAHITSHRPNSASLLSSQWACGTHFRLGGLERRTTVKGDRCPETTSISLACNRLAREDHCSLGNNLSIHRHLLHIGWLFFFRKCHTPNLSW